MNNHQFLQLVTNSFIRFLQTSSRSNEKLKILHGKIAEDIQIKLGSSYKIKSLGIGNGKEGKLDGRYMEKVVDILISKKEQDIAGIGVKFVMNNYSQNSNNYFENMLGETANIRSNSYPYFQIIIILNRLPYYKRDKSISKWEIFTENNALKYFILSKDNNFVPASNSKRHNLSQFDTLRPQKDRLRNLFQNKPNNPQRPNRRNRRTLLPRSRRSAIQSKDWSKHTRRLK